jgi:predicted small lipoprotein YifL
MISKAARLLATVTMTAILASGLVACGKKGPPRPPEGQESEYTYPQAYPAPSGVVPRDGEPQEDAGPLSIFNSGSRSQTKTY